jgi:hypothetical protein
MLNKSFFWFLGSVLCAVIAFTYLFFIYLRWDDHEPVKDSSVEVTLPVINWQKYQDLSKRIE